LVSDLYSLYPTGSETMEVGDTSPSPLNLEDTKVT
jgi:hypothetical protein